MSRSSIAELVGVPEPTLRALEMDGALPKYGTVPDDVYMTLAELYSAGRERGVSGQKFRRAMSLAKRGADAPEEGSMEPHQRWAYEIGKLSAVSRGEKEFADGVARLAKMMPECYAQYQEVQQSRVQSPSRDRLMKQCSDAFGRGKLGLPPEASGTEDAPPEGECAVKLEAPTVADAIAKAESGVGPLIPWGMLRVERRGVQLHGTERFAALAAFRNGDLPSEFVVLAGARPIRAAGVDWSDSGGGFSFDDSLRARGMSPGTVAFLLR